MKEKELEMITKVDGSTALRDFVNGMKTREIKKMRSIIKESLKKFYNLNGANLYIYAEKYNITKDYSISVDIRNCEDLENFGEFEPIISFVFHNEDTGKDIFVGSSDGCTVEDAIEFDKLFNSICKEILKSRKPFHKKNTKE